MTREEKINALGITDKTVAELVSDNTLDNCLITLYGYLPEEVTGASTSYDTVKRPQHYTKTSIECIDAMIETQGKEAVKAYCVCNAFKYIWRHNLKNGDEDIKKAAWYLNKAVELIDGGQHEKTD